MVFVLKKPSIGTSKLSYNFIFNTKISKPEIKPAYFYKKIGEIFYNLTDIVFQ